MENMSLQEENTSPEIRTNRRSSGGGGGGGGEQLKRIRWDRFLPTRSLRVLLVEHDDSTRHIVAALLRKCSYHVVAVADGMKAWEVMKGRSYGFDLVLTEFEMPSLSGIGLLGKIVGSENCRNVPVIMMSSQDSVGIVHKCMLKGASDFLVKPLRKNELRNLWQHVWRRHCSENNAASNQISSNVGDLSQTGETGDEGRDADQVLHESFGNKMDTKVELSRKQAATHGQSPKDAETHLELPQNNMNTIASPSILDDLRDKTSVVGDVSVQPMVHSVENNGHSSLRRAKGGKEKPNLNDQINSEEHPTESDGPRSSIMNRVFNPSALPLWELSLMTKFNGCGQHVKQKNILNHSNASAFSRYGGTSNREYADQPQSPVKPVASRLENVEHFQIYPDGNVDFGSLSSGSQPQNSSISPSNREDTSLHPQLSFMPPMPIPVGTAPYSSYCTGYGELLRPVIYHDNFSMVQSLPVAENAPLKLHSDCSIQQEDSFLSEFRCRDLNHPPPCRGEVDTEAGERRDFSSSHGEEVCRSGSISKDVLNNCGSNGSNDMITDATAATGIGMESGNEGGVQNCKRNGANSDLSLREAALIKFRLKRKDRCFAKKVRYHSRQKLAEQRPRVKGQFVSHKILQLHSRQEADGLY